MPEIASVCCLNRVCVCSCILLAWLSTVEASCPCISFTTEAVAAWISSIYALVLVIPLKELFSSFFYIVAAATVEPSWTKAFAFVASS